jgi:hypothetical protein
MLAASASRASDVFFTASHDGGQTFLPNVRISEAQPCADAAGNRVPHGDDKTTVGERWEAGGDYSGLVASGGIFHAIWADTRSGAYQLWHTTTRVEEIRPSKDDNLLIVHWPKNLMSWRARLSDGVVVVVGRSEHREPLLDCRFLTLQNSGNCSSTGGASLRRNSGAPMAGVIRTSEGGYLLDSGWHNL